MERSPLRAAAVALAIAGLALASCSDGDDAATDTDDAPDLQVATTVAPLTSIVATIGGPNVAVTGIVPEGTNSHTFEPKPSAAKTLATADIVFTNGLQLEEPTKDLAEANVRDGVPIVELGNEVLPEDEWIYDFSFPEEGSKPNPHLWTNPPMAKQYAEVVAEQLSALDPDGAATYEANLDAFSAEVDALDAAMVEATATVPAEQRRLLTYHDAYAYFADHYGWTVVGAIQPSDFAEPSPKDVAQLIEQIDDEDVPAIFGSEVFPSPVLEQIGSETGAAYVDVLRDDDLPGEPGDPEHSWLGLMRFDFVTMVDALGGDPSALEALDVGDAATDTATYPQ